MNNEKLIYTKRLANILVQNGFKILRSEINVKDVTKRVFIFENSEDLEAFVKTYQDNCKKERG